MTIQLYYFPTLNGHKVTIALEEMGLDYEIRLIDILAGDQTSPEFLAINPNGRIPAMVDGDVVIFESAAIMQYLGRRTGRFYPADEPTRARIDSWLFWQMAGLGPMSGQVNYFNRVASKADRDPRETDFAISRYRRETARLFGVLERGLEGREYVAGAYSIADMCCFTWVDKYPENGGGLDAFPRVRAWHGRIASRPAVERALKVGNDLLSPEVRARWKK
jgi:GSH-dependent disulfide-bond oxidoreductase